MSLLQAPVFVCFRAFLELIFLDIFRVFGSRGGVYSAFGDRARASCLGCALDSGFSDSLSCLLSIVAGIFVVLFSDAGLTSRWSRLQ